MRKIFLLSFLLPIPIYSMDRIRLELEDTIPLQNQVDQQENYDSLLSLVQSRIANKQNLDEPNAEFPDDTSPLHQSACDDFYLTITQLLLEHGADPNKTNSIGNTPLHIAARNISLKNIKLLLAKKANQNLLAISDMSPLSLICWMRNDTHDKNKADDRVIAVTTLLRAGANTNTKSLAGSCLHDVIAHPYQDFTYIQAIDTQENRLHFLSNRKELIKLIIDHGGDLSITNRKGKTPIELAHNNDYHPENKKYCIELADFAVTYLNASRKKLVTRILLQPLANPNFLLFMKLPKELVKKIVFMVYPSHKNKTTAA